MTETQKQLLRGALDAALAPPVAGEATLATLFYDRLFEVAPSVRELFRSPRATQEEKFTQMLAALRDALDRLDLVVPLVWKSGRAHKTYGAEAAHYAVVGEVLLWALERRLEPERVTDELRGAWRELYELVSQAMQAAAQT